jgi:4-hydroxybenzoate polyprenyltransferase
MSGFLLLVKSVNRFDIKLNVAYLQRMEQNRNIGKTIRSLLVSVLYSNLFISFCAFSLTIETYKLANLPASLPMATFVFLATLFTYNLSSIYSIVRKPNQKPNKLDSSWVQVHKKRLAALGIKSLLVGTFVFFYYDLEVNKLIILHLAIISIGYTVPIVYKSKKVRPLRSIPLLKVFLIAYVWAVVTVLFPLMDAGINILDAEATMLLFRRFMFILALALLFDIRDFTYDQKMNTLTIPGLLGVCTTKLISLALLTIYIVVATQTEAGNVQLAILISAIVAGLVVIFSSEKKPRLYYLILADGIMLLHAGLVYLAFS